MLTWCWKGTCSQVDLFKANLRLVTLENTHDQGPLPRYRFKAITADVGTAPVDFVLGKNKRTWLPADVASTDEGLISAELEGNPNQPRSTCDPTEISSANLVSIITELVNYPGTVGVHLDWIDLLRSGRSCSCMIWC